MEEEKKIENEREVKKQKSNKRLIIVILVIGMAIAFACGTLFGQKLFETNKTNPEEEKKEDKQEEKEEQVISQEENIIAAEDTYTVSTYGDNLKLYIINNGKVYYKINDKLFAGLSLCPDNYAYCKGNPTFNNDLSEIKEISNAKIIKLVPDVNASDESFINFVFTSDYKVYTIRETYDMDGKIGLPKIQLFNEDKEIVDIIDFDLDGNSYTFKLKDGSTYKK